MTPNMHSTLHLRPGRPTGSVVVQASFNWKASRNQRTPRPQNVAGPFYVDQTCIDCDTCRWMSPCFTREGDASAVTRQPETRDERIRALQALLSCPTHSIHGPPGAGDELKAAQQGLPAPVPGVPNVYHCGWHTEKSYAATSYLITHPAGNILVDSPRYNPVLARQLESLGGVKYMFLTHKDDVGDHEQWAKHFNAVRILHQGEIRKGTAGVEVQLEGEGPWPWSQVLNHPANHHHSQQQDLPADAGTDIQLVFTPGHTSHHVCLFYAPSKALFSGDHLCSPEEDEAADKLYLFKDFNWFSFPLQLRSVAKLLNYDWLHVLPGHGRAAHMRDATHRLQAVSTLLQEHQSAVQQA